MDNFAENDPSRQPNDVSDQVPQAHDVQPQLVTRPPKGNRKKLVMFVVGGGLLLALLAGAAYWFFLKGDDKKQAAQPAVNAQNEQANLPEVDPTPVSYKSTKLNIEITHRKDWTLKENASGEIAVTSPKISYVGSQGQSTTGVFTVKFRKGVTDAMKATIEKAVAPRDSEVIAYLAPTENQRQYTNLSYAGTKDLFNFFIITGNTELKVGNTFAYTLAMDGEFYLVVGGYGTDKNGSLSFDSVPKANMDSETLEHAVDIVESLKIY